MKTPPSSRIPALAFALLSTAGLLAQRGGSGAELTVSVTVTPICTVAVRAVDVIDDQAIDLRCRNFAATQPQPLVTHAPADALVGGDLLVGDDVLGAGHGVEMIVINF